jgi:hypothetical protein
LDSDRSKCPNRVRQFVPVGSHGARFRCLDSEVHGGSQRSTGGPRRYSDLSQAYTKSIWTVPEIKKCSSVRTCDMKRVRNRAQTRSRGSFRESDLLGHLMHPNRPSNSTPKWVHTVENTACVMHRSAANVGPNLGFANPRLSGQCEPSPDRDGTYAVR